MIRAFWYTTPPRIQGDELFRKLGREWTCPWCKAETARVDGDEDIGWVEIPMSRQPVPYICQGCAHDVYGTCAEHEFETHPYRDIVEDAAKKEGLPLKEFRKLCVQHQVTLLDAQLQDEDSTELRQRRDNLANLLKQL